MRYKDSRAKRSKARPGRATAWEVRQVLGIPEVRNPSDEYVGRVGADGSVVVFSKRTNKPIASMSNDELEQRATFQKLNITPPTSPGASYTGGYSNSNRFKKSPSKTAMKKINTLQKGLGYVSSLIGVIGTIGAGAAGIMSIAKSLRGSMESEISRERANV